MTDRIDYGNLMHEALRGLIRKVLTQVAEHGLPGEHHFFITFDTGHSEVRIAPWLKERYPEEMTVVLQHWYEGLEVTEDGFGVTLNFGDSPEQLYIPYDSLLTFVDPFVEFGLRFETLESDEDDPEPPESPAPDDATPEHATEGEVVSLDKFRK
ncbi:MAG: ClpXP protease specificity-enhancing factor SspB [Pseudomonadota bacterium]